MFDLVVGRRTLSVARGRTYRRCVGGASGTVGRTSARRQAGLRAGRDDGRFPKNRNTTAARRAILCGNVVLMKKVLLLYALAVTLLLAGNVRRYRSQTRRLEQNQHALLSQMEHYRTRAGEAAASVEVLRLRCREFERLHTDDAERIRQLGIRLRRVEATATSVTATEVAVRAPLRDSVVRRDLPSVCDSVRLQAIVRFDSVRLFRWCDPWVTVEGTIRGDSVACRIESVDTLRQVVHRVPRRFLFFRFGTKAVRQEIVSSNPHTRIVYTEYVQFAK